jgi:flagellar motor switch protein FliG
MAGIERTDMQALAQIKPVKMAVPQTPVPPLSLSPREKAAIVVRFLKAEGALPPLSDLPEHLQAALTEQMARMRVVDRATVAAVIAEFVGELEGVGLTFPGGIDGALGLMDGHISASAADRLRRLAGASTRADPWERIGALPPERLAPLLDRESVEVAAVALSKLPVPKAADLLTRMPGDRARRVAFAVARTADVHPETVRRIGNALIAEAEATPPRAFDAAPGDRVGAILNVSPAETRDSLLAALDDADAGFAAEVRKAIFTFDHIPARLVPRDVPKVMRVVEPARLVTALAAAEAAGGALAATAAHILDNISQRMAQSLREEMAQRGTVPPRDAEAAMTAVVQAIRQLEATGEVVLVQPDG